MAASTSSSSSNEEKRITLILSPPILLTDQIRTAVNEAETFKSECSDIAIHSDHLCQMFRSLARLAASTGGPVYERPLQRIVSNVVRNLNRALSLVKKCKRVNKLRRCITIVSNDDFKKLLDVLKSSVADMKWLLTIFDPSDGRSGAGGGVGINLSLPPIVSNDPMISWVWSFTASLYIGELNDKIEAADELASLAIDNDRNKMIIIEEGSIVPLLKLLKENSSPEAQIASAIALYNLSTNEERVRVIIDELGVPIILQVLNNSPMKVQLHLANLVAKMAENSTLAQEVFERQNVIRPLVKLLSFDMLMCDSQDEVKLAMKINCAKALSMLARGNISISKRITKTKGLLCLVKLVEKEEGDLRFNCLNAIMEITSSAEMDAELRQVAFKNNSPARKALLEQLLRVIKDSGEPRIQVPAIRCIGFLARTFPARETRVIRVLVEQLGSLNQALSIEAAYSLGKFVAIENYLCVEHSRTIIDFDGVSSLMEMLVRGDERAKINGAVLLCYLAINAGSYEALDQANVL